MDYHKLWVWRESLTLAISVMSHGERSKPLKAADTVRK